MTKRILLWFVPLGFLGLFFFYPLGVVFQASLTGKDASTMLQAAFRAGILDTIGFTLWQAALSTLLTLLVGLPAAYLLAKFDFPGKKAVSLLTNLPFILPTVVVAAGFNALIGPRGWLNILLQACFRLEQPPIQVLGTISAILLAHVFYNLTIVIRLVGSAWAGLNPRLGMAARTLGATAWQEFKTVTLPLLMPSLASALVLVFLFDFTSFGVIILLGGSGNATLEVEIYSQAMHFFNLPLASLLTIIQFGFTLVLSVIYKWVSVKTIPLTPIGERAGTRQPVDWRQKLFVVCMTVILVVLVASPLLSLVSRSFIRLEADRGQRGGIQTGLTTTYYASLFENPRQSIFYVPPVEAIRNSLQYALITALISVSVGLLASYGLRGQGIFTRGMDVVLMLPLGASAVTMGLGLLLAFSRPGLNWSTAPWMVPVAHSLVALPLVIRSLSPALNAIPNDLHASAGVLGARAYQVFWQVDLPLLRRPLITSLIFSFTISLGEFGATTFLTRPDAPTIPIAIFRYLSQPGGLNYGQAMAMATILLLVFTIGIIIIEKIRLPGVESF